MNAQELKRIADAVGELRGWDFSGLRIDRDPVPWEYADVIRRYLSPSSHVLDIGTGGGERVLSLAPHFGVGIGIDRKPEMIRVALENRGSSFHDKVSFEVMRAQDLRFPEGTFDVILNRHAPVFYDQVVRVLRSGGYFITQQVGGRNTQNVFDAFGWGSNGEYWRRFFAERGMPFQDVTMLRKLFPEVGCRIVTYDEYNARYYFEDVESLIFWLKWSPLPEDLDPDRHYRQVNELIEHYRTARGIETNEHRELLIVQKRAAD